MGCKGSGIRRQKAIAERYEVCGIDCQLLGHFELITGLISTSAQASS